MTQHDQEGERVSLALGLTETEVDALLDLILSHGMAITPKNINTMSRLHRRLREMKRRLQEMKHPNETPAQSEGPNRQD